MSSEKFAHPRTQALIDTYALSFAVPSIPDMAEIMSHATEELNQIGLISGWLPAGRRRMRAIRLQAATRVLAIALSGVPGELDQSTIHDVIETAIDDLDEKANACVRWNRKPFRQLLWAIQRAPVATPAMIPHILSDIVVKAAISIETDQNTS